MATNNAISFNQLKKSVFNMKNYVNYNANNPYTVKTLLDETIAIDANCNITNNGNAVSVYKSESTDGYTCYFCWNKTNTPIDINEEFISMKIYINDKLIYKQVPKHITSSGIAVSINSIVDKYLDKDTNVIKLVSLAMQPNKKVYYDENGKNHSDDEENTQSYKATVSIKKGQQNPGTVRVVGEFLTENKNYLGINCFKSEKYGSLTYASNVEDTGLGSINFSNDPSPDYTFIMPCSSRNNSFKNTCSNGIIFGFGNKLNGINYYSILGYNNTIERKANGTYNESFVNILGQYNTYKADASTVNYKPVSIIGNYINACNSGLYIGMAGTFEKDDIMGIADGTARKEKIIFRVKRDGRVKASTPTENDDLTTKKYVDDKVAGIVNSAPETLDTLKELADALGNDANFSTTVTTQIGKKVDKVDGMSLTHNDLTNELKANYDAAYTYSQTKLSYNDLNDLPTIPSIDGLVTEKDTVDKINSLTNPNGLFDYSTLTNVNKNTISEVFPDLLNGNYNKLLHCYKSLTIEQNKASYLKDYINAAIVKIYDEENNILYSKTIAIINNTSSSMTNIYLNKIKESFMVTIYLDTALDQSNNLIPNSKSDAVASITLTKTKNNEEFINKIKNLKIQIYLASFAFLNKNNKLVYTPTEDYNPATKKYVDDANIEATDEEVDAMLLEVLGGDYSVQS